MTGHLKDNLFVLTALQGGLRGGVGALFWAKKWPENQFVLRYFHITPLFFFKQKTAYEIGVRLVGSEMCIRDSIQSYLRIWDVMIPLSQVRLRPKNCLLYTSDAADE